MEMEGIITMRMNSDQNERARKMVAEIQVW